MRQVLIPLHIDSADPVLGGVVHALSGFTMGTSWSVRLVMGRTPPGPEWARSIQEELDNVVAQMSTWDPSSNLMRFNTASPGSWHVLSEECFTVLSAAMDVARATDGAYDPTAGALVNLWGFGPTRRFDQPGFAPPSPQQIDAARALGGWEKLAMDPDGRRVRQPGGLQLDFSSIAKGFAVDQVTRRLQARGIESCMVEVGGELRGLGVKPDGQPWWVALEHPDDGPPAGDPAGASGMSEAVLALHGVSVATSGDYRRHFEINGQRHAHTVDPRTGWPVSNRVASVSVVHPDCMMADAWATALTVMGVERGLAEADARGLIARFVVRNADPAVPQRLSTGFTEHMSRSFMSWVS